MKHRVASPMQDHDVIGSPAIVVASSIRRPPLESDGVLLVSEWTESRFSQEAVGLKCRVSRTLN